VRDSAAGSWCLEAAAGDPRNFLDVEVAFDWQQEGFALFSGQLLDRPE